MEMLMQVFISIGDPPAKFHVQLQKGNADLFKWFSIKLLKKQSRSLSTGSKEKGVT